MMTKDILVIPVPTVTLESTFNTSGRLVSPHRNRFHLKKLETLVCTQNWLWNEIRGNNNNNH